MFRRLKIISVFLLLFLIFLPSLAQSQTAVGKFTFVQGRVDILRQPAPRAMPVKMGDAVFVGDIIRAKSGSKAEITFKDGNIVRVAPNTRVEISEYMFDEAKGKGILKLSRGKVQAIIQEKIAKRIATFGEANRFEIHTPTAILGVRGTNFIPSYHRNSSNVLVLEGAVFAYSLKYPDLVVTVNAGYITTIPPDQPVQPARPFTDAEKKMYEGDFSPTGGSGEKSEAEDTVISEATTGPAEPGALEPGPESFTPMDTLTETPGGDLTQIVQPPPITETVGSDTTPPDTTPPELTITAPKAPMVTGSGDIIVDIEASETGITYTYSLNQGAWNTVNELPIKISKDDIGEGINTLEVKATDAANNTSDPISYKWFVGNTQYSLEGNLTGSLSGSVLSTSEGLRLVSNGNQGAWLLHYSGDGAIPNELTLISGGKSYGPNSEKFDGYWLSKIEDATASNGSISGTSSFKYLSNSFLGLGPGAVSGTFGSLWEVTDLGLGTYTEKPLVFGGSTGGSFIYWDIDDMSNIGKMQGLMGGTESLWSGSPSFLSLGKYEGQDGNTLWDMDIGSESLSGWTSDGGAFLGSIGGIAMNDNLEGMAIGIYIKNTGETGYIYSNDVSGSLYPGIEMYELEGVLTSAAMGTTEISPSQIYNFIEEKQFGVFGGISGESGYINGSMELDNVTLADQKWGIWFGGSGGTYDVTPSTNWTADIGGVGYYGDILEHVWIGDIRGTGWSGSRLSGTVSGRFLNTEEMGTFSGDLIGTYSEGGSGTWQALSGGVYTWAPLTFGTGLYGSFMHWNGEGISGDGMIEGLMGGTDSLYSGSSFLSFRSYDNFNNKTLWGMDIGAEGTSGWTSDGGAFLGSIGGVVLDDNLEGLEIALLLKPTDTPGQYEAGYISSNNMIGTLYPGIGMYELGGNLIAVTMGTTSVSPSQLYWGSESLENDEWSFNIAGGINGEVNGSDIKLEEADKTHQEWGIWRFTATG